MPTPPTLRITRTKSGTYTLHLHRPGRAPERWRAGIPNYEEAVHRAQVVAGMNGYRVDKKEYHT
jgi:hypothetical protein